MLGTWRLILALMVVNAHLWSPWWPGGFAVMSFYSISGYLMTLIMNQSYQYNRSGIGRFWINRFLRLYPSYWAAAAISLALIVYLPADFVIGWNRKLTLPHSAYEIISNFTLIGLIQLPGHEITATLPLIGQIHIPAVASSLVPPAWAVSIELVFYLLISVWFGRTLRRALILAGLGVVYTVMVFVVFNGNFYLRYFFVAAAALPFGLGCTLYHMQKRLSCNPAFCNRYKLITLVTLIGYLGTFIVALSVSGKFHTDIAIYFNLIFSVMLLHTLTTFRPQRGGRLKRIDGFLGDLFYPVYLIHWQAGILMAWWFDTTEKIGYIAILAALLAIAYAVLDRTLIILPIERIRSMVRGSPSVYTPANAKGVNP